MSAGTQIAGVSRLGFLEFILVLFATFALCTVILAASYADRARNSRMGMAVIGVVLLLNVFFALNGLLAVVPGVETTSDTSKSASAADWGTLIASVIVAGTATLLLLQPVRERLVTLFPRHKAARSAEKQREQYTPPEQIAAPVQRKVGEPLFPQMLNYYTTSTAHADVTVSTAPVSSDRIPTGKFGAYRVRGFNPASYVHMIALILAIYLLGSQLIGFIAGGGLEGLAESYQEAGLDVWSLFGNSLPLVVIPFVGVGLGVRRNLRQALDRLGLGVVTREGVALSIGVTFALFVGLFVIGLVWTLVVPQDIYEEQTQASKALSDSIDTIGLAFLVAATAAIGEEIAFRGALQPVIGFWPTALIFTLTHTQYALTPAWLIIFGVAVAFGWIRQRYNTTVAILTHFWYNLFQLLLLFAVPEEVTESLLRLF